MPPQDETGTDQPTAPDRAEEKKVDVPQNETPVAETAPDATPTDGSAPTEDHSQQVPENETGTTDGDSTTDDSVAKTEGAEASE